MKRSVFLWLLGAEAVGCVLLCLGRNLWPGLFTAALAFPFEQIGLGLRALSLHSAVGNGCAVALYGMLCLLPLGALALIRRKRPFWGEDALLMVLSVLLFAALYGMINPGRLSMWFGRQLSIAVDKALLGGVIYSLLAGYAVLRMVRSFYQADKAGLLRWLYGMLTAMGMIWVYLIFGYGLGEVLDSFAQLSSGNTAANGALVLTQVMLALQGLVNVWPDGLTLAVVMVLRRLVRQLQEEQAGWTLLDPLVKLCGRSLAAMVLVNIGWNLLQLLLVRHLLIVNVQVQFPFFSVLFVLGVLLFARYIRENQRLRDDNALFI